MRIRLDSGNTKMGESTANKSHHTSQQNNPEKYKRRFEESYRGFGAIVSPTLGLILLYEVVFSAMIRESKSEMKMIESILLVKIDGEIRIKYMAFTCF